MAAKRSKRNKQDAPYFSSLGIDRDGFDVQYIDSFKGRGVFSCQAFQKGDFLIEYRGELITKSECENRIKVYHYALKVYMFDFHFNGKKFSIDAAKDDGSLGRLVNDDHINPNSKMKIIRVDGKPHLWLFAIKDISPGEEITYNYGDCNWPWRRKPNNVALGPSNKDNTLQTVKEIMCQPADVAMSPTNKDNTLQPVEEMMCQPADVAMSPTNKDNTLQTVKEIMCQPADVAMSPTNKDNTLQPVEEMMCQPADVAMSPTNKDNTLQPVEEMMCQPADVAMSPTNKDNTLQTVKEMMCQAADVAMRPTNKDNTLQTVKEIMCQPADVDMSPTNKDNTLQPVEEMMCQPADVAMSPTNKDNTLQTVKEIMCQPADVAMRPTNMDNTLQPVEEMMCQPADVAMSPTNKDNTLQTVKEIMCQPADVDMSPTNKDNTLQTVKEIMCQPADVAMSPTNKDNTLQPVEEMMCQPADVAMSPTNKDNTLQTVKEIMCQPADVAMSPTNKDNTLQTVKEIMCQPADVAMRPTNMDNTLQPVEEMMCQPADVAMSPTNKDNTLQTVKEMMCQAADVAMSLTNIDNTLQTVKEMMCQPADVAMRPTNMDNTLQTVKEIICQSADVAMSPTNKDNTLQDCEHDLFTDDMSSFDKCVICRGPYAPLKWISERCKVCYKSWHKSCYVKHMKDTIARRPETSEEQSSSNMASEEEEYVPDSHSDSNSSGDEPLELSQIYPKHLEVQISEVSTSKPHLKKKGRHRDRLIEEDIDPLFEAAESMPQDAVSSNPLEISGSQAEVENGASDSEDMLVNESTEAEGMQSSNTSSLGNKTYCYICGKPQTKFTRHLKMHEKTHADVAHVLNLPKKSKERMKILTKLRNKGNYNHNQEVLKSGAGLLKHRRTAKINYNQKEYVHCMYCQALYIKRNLWRHVHKCSSNPTAANPVMGRTRVLSLAAMSESVMNEKISSGVWKLLSVMRDDEITTTVRSDYCILQLAQSHLNKHGQDKSEYIRQKLREIGRLVLTLRKEFSIQTSEDAVRPAHFLSVIRAIKNVAGFDEEKNDYRTPSLALKLGHALQKINNIVHCRALMAEDSKLIESTQTFKTLLTSKWSELVSHRALTTLNERHFNKPSTLPFTEDVQRLHKHLAKTAEDAFKNLEMTSSPKSYGKLCKTTMANIILFNRRRGGEVSKMQLKGFLERDASALHKDVAVGLTKFELELCNHFSRVEIRGKRGRKVAVLLSPDMVNALMHLINKRKDCGVPEENPFLFARPHCLTPYRGTDCLRLYASECGAKNPELLRSTQLRKHIATLSQVLNLKDHELDQVADFLGHDIRVHREYYRLPEATTQLAKISKLLLAMEKGSLLSLQGKTLDQIEIEENLDLSDDEQSEESDAEDEIPPIDPLTDLDSAGMNRTEQPVDEHPGTSVLSSKGSAVEGAGQSEEPAGISVLSSQDLEADQEGTPTVSSENARRAQKHKWSNQEVAAVMKHFKGHIAKGTLATVIECKQCKKAEHPSLDDRTIQNIRDFVRNRGTAVKRKKNP